VVLSGRWMRPACPCVCMQYCVARCWLPPVGLALPLASTAVTCQPYFRRLAHSTTSPRCYWLTMPPLPFSHAVGKAVADSFSFFLGSEWVWGAVGVAWGSLLMYTLAGVCALTYTNPERPRPTGKPGQHPALLVAVSAALACMYAALVFYSAMHALCLDAWVPASHCPAHASLGHEVGCPAPLFEQHTLPYAALQSPRRSRRRR
jgi:hypothetical protein